MTAFFHAAPHCGVPGGVGAEVLPSLPRLRAAMNRRRAGRGLPWRVLERLLGLLERIYAAKTPATGV